MNFLDVGENLCTFPRYQTLPRVAVKWLSLICIEICLITATADKCVFAREEGVNDFVVSRCCVNVLTMNLRTILVFCS